MPVPAVHQSSVSPTRRPPAIRTSRPRATGAADAAGVRSVSGSARSAVGKPETSVRQRRAADTAKRPIAEHSANSKEIQKQPEPPRKQTLVVRLKLSVPLVRVLVALEKAGQKSSRMVEAALWDNQKIRDAASIIGLRRIIPKRPTTAKRLQPRHVMNALAATQKNTHRSDRVGA